MIATLGAFALTLAACQSGVPPTPTPMPSQRSTPNAESGYSDAEKAALVRERIDWLYCSSEPRSDWCEYVQLVDGAPDVAVRDGTSVFVSVKRSIPNELATQLCQAVAANSFDDNAEPIGYLYVHVQAGPYDFRADCEVLP